MADSVAVRVVSETDERIVVHCTNISDGTGESAVVKVDRSTLKVRGAEPALLALEKVVFNCDGMAVRVLFDHTTDDLALALSGMGTIDFGSYVPGAGPGYVNGMMRDPNSAGGTGDILFTTVGHTSGDTYNVTLYVRKLQSFQV